MARAIWKGKLALGEEAVPVKLYSALEDHRVHFRLLHAADQVPIEQRIVRKSDGKEVPKDERRKAFPLDRERAVILQPDELTELQPEASRDIAICRFVPPSAIGDQWYDRPYYVGPDDDEEKRYFALVEAISRSNTVGIARWVMRGKRYAGALQVHQGYLMMMTLRRAEQVLAISRLEIPAAGKPDASELRLAQQLVSSIEDDFDPGEWQDDYRERVCELIRMKASGKTVKLPSRKRTKPMGGLADQLRNSLAAAKEKKVA